MRSAIQERGFGKVVIVLGVYFVVGSQTVAEDCSVPGMW